jgi:hypothetical protein
VVVTSKVIEWLQEFWQVDFGYETDTIETVSALYEKFYQRAHEEIETLKLQNVEEIECIDSVLVFL